jgi:hypothetical protein
MGKPSWLGDLVVVLNHFPFSVRSTFAYCDLIANVKVSMNLHIDTMISSSKGHLLTGRLERDEDGTLGHQTLCFRHYLNIPIASH